MTSAEPLPRTPRRHRRWIAGALVLAALGTCWKFWLFRQQTYYLGEIETVLKWRWGWAYEAIIDADRDGRPEEIWRMAPYARSFTCQNDVESVWRDEDGDGVLERYAYDNAARRIVRPSETAE